MKKLKHFIACGSTDGNLYFINSSSFDEVATFRCHQSGVNSLAYCDVIRKETKFLLLATGGDDNSICILLFKDEGSSLKRIAECRINESHSAQVTGLHLKNSDPVIMSSASIDQRVIRWIVNIQENTIICQRVACHVTHVSDVAGLDIYNNNYFVCGQGLSHFLLDPIV